MMDLFNIRRDISYQLRSSLSWQQEPEVRKLSVASSRGSDYGSLR